MDTLLSMRLSHTTKPVMLALLVLVFLAGALPLTGPTPALAAPMLRRGDAMPLILYVRSRRQTGGVLSLFGGGGEEAEEAAEGPAAATGSAPPLLGPRDELALGKHESQTRRTVSPELGPRFAVHRTATMPVPLLREALQQMLGDITLLESDAAVRVRLGRGAQRETTWIPIVRVSPYYEGKRYLPQRLALQLRSTTLQPQLMTRYPEVLSGLRLRLGYRIGVTGEVTSVSITPEYRQATQQELSAPRGAAMTLHYDWSEHRPYNPTRALTMCSAVAVLAGMVVTYVILFVQRGKTSKQFRRRVVSVRHRDD